MIIKKVILVVALITTMVILMAYRYKNTNSDKVASVIEISPLINRSDIVKEIATNPRNGSDSMLLDQKVTITFNKKMNPLTIDQTTFTLKGPSDVSGTISYDGYKATFSPSQPLISNTIYTATISTGAMSEKNIPLTNEYIWTFTSGSINVTRN